LAVSLSLCAPARELGNTLGQVTTADPSLLRLQQRAKVLLQLGLVVTPYVAEVVLVVVVVDVVVVVVVVVIVVEARLVLVGETLGE